MVAFTIILFGQVITGGSRSITLTLKLQRAVLPLASLAVTITVVVPIENCAPDGIDVVTSTFEQLFCTTGGGKFTVAPDAPTAAFTVISAGQSIIKGASFTMTSNVQTALLPARSMAVTVTGVVPIGKTAPRGGTAVMVARLQLSVIFGIG
jgi:hypothetical protein